MLYQLSIDSTKRAQPGKVFKQTREHFIKLEICIGR